MNKLCAFVHENLDLLDENQEMKDTLCRKVREMTEVLPEFKDEGLSFLELLMYIAPEDLFHEDPLVLD